LHQFSSVRDGPFGDETQNARSKSAGEHCRRINGKDCSVVPIACPDMRRLVAPIPAASPKLLVLESPLITAVDRPPAITCTWRNSRSPLSLDARAQTGALPYLRTLDGISESP
jgi:hypothetical protein